VRNEDAVLRFTDDGAVRSVPMRSALALNSGPCLQAACLQGRGIAQLSRPVCQRLIDRGELIEVLPNFSPPPLQLSVLLSHRRHIAPRVEAVVNWTIQVVRPHMLERT